MFKFDKHSKFVIVLNESVNALRVAEVLQTFGITNVLFLEQTSSSVNLFSYNLQLTKMIIKTVCDENLFHDKLSKLIGFVYYVTILYTHTVDVEVNHEQYIKSSLLSSIIGHQNATPSYRKMNEKSSEIFSTFFDVIIPYYDVYKYEYHKLIERLFIPKHTELCLIVPKIRDPQFLMILFRPFRFQLWAFVIIGYCILNLIEHLLTKRIFKYSENKLPLQRLVESFCLFILCESYSAKLTAFSNSPIDSVYPKSLEEFKSSPIQLMIPTPEWLMYASTIPVLSGKCILFNPSTTYDWDKVALFGKCDILAERTVQNPLNHMGVVISSTKYHVINEPLAVAHFSLLFNKFSPLERASRDIISRIDEAGLMQGLVTERQRQTGKDDLGGNASLLNGFDPIYRTIARLWAAAFCLFVLQWMHVSILEQIHYNVVFLIGLSVFLKN